MRCAAVILAGGRGSRLGGVRKAELRVDGDALLAYVLAAVEACSERVVVGFPDLDVPAGVVLTREDPPGSGPAAGIAAGMARVGAGADWVLVLACDLPGAGEIVPELLAAAAAAPAQVESILARTPSADLPPGDRAGDRGGDRAGVRAGDVEGRTEWLTGIHRAGALRRVIAARGEGLIDGSVRRLFASMRQATIAAPPGSTRDVDTWEDHRYWLARAGEGRER
ncbi:NTP transferase domain-containing protein [Pseudactinotalea sp. HY160]|uniref:molybdenum cofactor guanylyltransferase n=1 Tax=Pseudactinotalea sp. HY160 TaxID=2654490 RepID=UPI00128E8AC5|nr:NTP transferase domain-containing protein [Pseudactinotalea sp. HY160]MPV49080.1 NTP transferase domain-containing protein [Pseudactinotalea sp. HY160]